MVMDPSGAAIPNAEVTLTSIATGSVSKFSTGPDGLYSFLNLPSGGYELKASAHGFRDYVQKGITVYINTVARVDIKLDLGTAIQTVEVSANATLLSTESPTRQEGITPDTIQELPLIVSERPRSAASFAILMPGVSTGGTANPFDSRINGGLQSGDEAIVDGVSMQQGLMSQTGMISIFQDFAYSPDMVSEIKLLTANYEPQYGSTTSSQIIANTRSGTNEYHATAYWYHRNTVLNAREWGSGDRGKNLQNDFGASVGGPAKLPLLWGGRRKTYFFVNFEGYRIAGGSTRPVITLPTTQERNGDFSDWVDSNGNLIPIYDPNTSVYDTSGNLVSRQQFMGCNGVTPNVICTSGPNTSPLWQSMQPLANQWLPFLPEPNRPGIKNNYQVPRAIPDVLLGHTNDWLIKGDMNWRDRDTFFVSIRYQGAAPLYNSVLPLQLAPENFTQPQYAFVNRGGWDHTFSPVLINSMRLGYLDRNEGYGAIDTPFGDKLPQIPGVSTHAYPPQINFSEYQNWGSSTGSNLTQRTERPSKIINDLLTWVKGKHTLKFGGEFRSLGENNRDASNGSGTFNFTDASTAVKGVQSGNGFASFLLGAVDNASVTYHAIGSWYPRARAYIWHVGDTFKLTPKLTLSYGVRYDNFTPSWEKYDQFSFFDPLSPNPAAGNRLGRLAFGGTRWGAASFGRRYPERHWNRGFSPRLGFAYSLNNRTVVRSGYGIFYTQAFYPGWGGGISTDGFSKTDSRGSLNGFTPSFSLFDPAGFLAPYQAPFNAAYTPVIPPIIDAGAQNGSGLNYRPFDANRLSNAQQWNLTVEHQFTNNFYISTAYVGNKGTRLPSSAVPLNALNPSLLPVYAFTNPTTRGPDSHLNDIVPDDTTVVDGVLSPYTGWVAQMNDAGCSATVGQALLPYPQYCDQLRGSNENAGNSTYHSFQFKAEKRFSQGTFLLASYTLSKLITNSDQVDQPAGALDWSGAHGVISPFERKRNKALAVDDVPQVLSIAFVYSLPFGQGKRWASSNRLLGKVVGGWEATGTIRWSSGIPFFFRSGNCAVPGYFRAGCIPAILPGKNPWAQSKSNFDPNKPLFDVKAFENQLLDANGSPVLDNSGNPITRFGNYYGSGSRISNLRGFAYHNQDLALIKETKITERLRWQLGFEAFNLWNWHIFNGSGEFGSGAFDIDVASGTFGTWNGTITAPRVIQFRSRLSF
ncbi:MAG: hypothetical protein DMG23_06045 [Acidobacteria bacterium]|nr:MAG: hypothetical protein DMG23_06045 [Acidobacteriota bacterium]